MPDFFLLRTSNPYQIIQTSGQWLRSMINVGSFLRFLVLHVPPHWLFLYGYNRCVRLTLVLTRGALEGSVLSDSNGSSGNRFGLRSFPRGCSLFQRI